MSVLPPATNGTTTVTGRVGQLSLACETTGDSARRVKAIPSPCRDRRRHAALGRAALSSGGALVGTLRAALDVSALNVEVAKLQISYRRVLQCISTSR
jgi:hypothetical protein